MNDPVRVLSPDKGVRVRPSTELQEVIDILLEENIGAVLVLDDEQKLVGIFTERDLLMKVAGLVDDYPTRTVGEFMTPNPRMVEADDRLAFALHVMEVGGYRHIPVVEDGEPVGIISVRGMLRHITELCPDR